MGKLRIILADDHPILRAGLRGLIEAQPDMEVVDEAIDGENALQKSMALRPDIVVMDLSMPGLGGVEATAQIRRDCPKVRVVVLSIHEHSGYVGQSLTAGALGYVLKRSAADDLVHAIRRVAAGETYLDPAVAGQVVAEITGFRSGNLAALSDREAEVVRLIAQGFMLKQIAMKLGVESRTIETYKARAMEKLALRTRVDLVRYAARLASRRVKSFSPGCKFLPLHSPGYLGNHSHFALAA